MNTENYEIIEFIDLLDYTFSDKFVEKWRYKYSIALIKKKSLYQYLSKKCKYNSEQIDSFFLDIEVDIYYPLVM